MTYEKYIIKPQVSDKDLDEYEARWNFRYANDPQIQERAQRTEDERVRKLGELMDTQIESRTDFSHARGDENGTD